MLVLLIGDHYNMSRATAIKIDTTNDDKRTSYNSIRNMS